MKTHKVKFGGEFTINGIDDGFITYCGLSDWNVICEDLKENGLVGQDDSCTCKKCNKFYELNIKKHNKEYEEHKKHYQF